MRRGSLVWVLFGFIVFKISIDTATTCSWDVMHCDREEILCNAEESILLDSKRPLPRTHCFAIKDLDEGRHRNYEIGVDLLSLESDEGKNSGYLGITFNYLDPMNYDYVYLE